MEVNRGNKKLLERLVEISKGKHVRVLAPDSIALGGATHPRYGYRVRAASSLLDVAGLIPAEVSEPGREKKRDSVD